jgi:hypothetical protein
MRSKKRTAPRYAIVPGDFVLFVDEDGNRPRLVHYRVLLYLASWTDRHGWFKRKQHMLQTDMAEEAQLSRPKFCSALNDLLKWGFVEQHVSQRDGRIAYYRVRMDRGLPEDGDDEAEDGDLSPLGNIVWGEEGAGNVSPGGDINREQLCHQVRTDQSPGGNSCLYRDTNRISHNPLTTTRVASANVCVKFGKTIENIYSEKPELAYVIDTFLGPLFASTRQPTGVESFPAFLRAIRDAIGERELSVSVLERARKLASAKRTVMPALPECLAFCDQAKIFVEAERAACAQARSAEQRREKRLPDPLVATRVDALRERLRNRLGRKVFEAWLQELECERIDGAVLVVSVPTAFTKRWIDEHFSQALRECAASEFSGIGEVQVVVRGAGVLSENTQGAAA